MTRPDGELLPFTPMHMMTDPEQGDETRAMLSALPAGMLCPGHSAAMERRRP